jgi:thioesterase superfamily protein 4
MDDITPRISSAPWAAALINDPNWKLIDTSSRFPKPSGEDTFIGETLKTDQTIRTFLSFRPTRQIQDNVPFAEIRAIVDLGTGITGYPHTAHGGFQATLLDELCGAIVNLNRDARAERMQRLGQTVDVPPYYTACSSP